LALCHIVAQKKSELLEHFKADKDVLPHSALLYSAKNLLRNFNCLIIDYFKENIKNNLYFYNNIFVYVGFYITLLMCSNNKIVCYNVGNATADANMRRQNPFEQSKEVKVPSSSVAL